MSILEQLQQRSGNTCELTGVSDDLVVYAVPPADAPTMENAILISDRLIDQLEGKDALDSTLWQAHLPTTMWSDVPAVQVAIWRLLNRMKQESWAAESLDMLYLDEASLSWAQSGAEVVEATDSDLHKDSNGAILENGDSVVLTKSLDVKGSQINARIGTVVKNIRLVPDNTEQIEGRVEGQQIVILTKFVRKHNG